MKRSPLLLKNYFVTELAIKANPVAEGEPLLSEGEATTQTKVETAQRADDKRQWRVALKINSTPAEKNSCSYTATVDLLGFFEVDKSFPEEKIGDIVSSNAPALLYSAARELILLVTGRGPFPPLSLPCSTFIDETPSAKKRAEESKKAQELEESKK